MKTLKGQKVTTGQTVDMLKAQEKELGSQIWGIRVLKSSHANQGIWKAILMPRAGCILRKT